MPLYAADLGITGLTDVGVTEIADDKSTAVARVEGVGNGITELGTTGIYYRNWTLDASTALLYWNSAATTAAVAVGSAAEASIDATLEDTQDIQSRIPAALVGGRMSSDVVAISGSTAAADNLESSALTIATGEAAAGTLSTTQMTTNLPEDTDDHFNGRIIIWTSGVLFQQATDITDYDGASKMLTFTAVTEAPTASDTFVIV